MINVVFFPQSSVGFVREGPTLRDGSRDRVCCLPTKMEAALRDGFEHTRGAAAAKIAVGARGTSAAQLSIEQVFDCVDR